MTDTDQNVTVVITTKNRKLELRSAISSTLRQSVPVEILVFDDGSTDGTSELVRAEFPQVRLERVDESLGIVRARNAAIGLATNPVVITIDDDCLFVSPATIAQTMADFDHPRIAAVCIPSIDVKMGPTVYGKAPADDGVYISSEFRGGANAMRREVFLQLGRYRGYLFRQGEESDYSIRLLDAGYVVRLGRGDPIHHLESPIRHKPQVLYYQARNHLLFVSYNVPMPYLILHGGKTLWNLLRSGWSKGFLAASSRGIVAGIAASLHEISRRKAVSRQTYRLFRRLRMAGPIALDTVESDLNPLRRDVPARGKVMTGGHAAGHTFS